MSRSRVELQFRTRSRRRATAEGEALLIAFRFGPIRVFIIANLPETDNRTDPTQPQKPGVTRPLVYVKLGIEPDADWHVSRDTWSATGTHDDT